MRLRFTFLLLLVSVVAWSQSSLRFKPHYYTVQFAGSIGTVSAGVGYHIIKNKASVSGHYGYVPASLGGDLHIAAAKFLYHPWQFSWRPGVDFKLLSFGAMTTYHFGEEFHSRWPRHRYPDGYYWWRPAIRAHLLLENSVDLSPVKGPFQRVNLFLEANSNELYLVSYALNTKALKLHDIFKLGIGARLYLRQRHTI